MRRPTMLTVVSLVVPFLAACRADRLTEPTAADARVLSATIPEQPPDGFGCQQAAPLTLYVEARRGKGVGKPSTAYLTIGDALAAASKAGACWVRLLLLGGTFDESFIVPFAHLELRAAQGRNVIAGAIANNGQWLEVDGVSLQVTGPVGIRQTGGRLQLVGVSISGALNDTKNPDSGIGLWLDGGALATLDLVVLDGNGNQAIRVEGAGTEAWLTGVAVDHTGIYPDELARVIAGTATDDDHLGAVQVSNGAKAIMKFSTITNSLVSALNVNHDAQVLLVRSRVSNTAQGTLGSATTGSFNIASRLGAAVEAFWLNTRDAVFDLVVRNDAFLTLHHSVVGGAAVGLSLQALTPAPGYVPSLCARLDHTIYTDVDIPLSADFYPPPGTTGDPALCRRVVDDPRPF